MENVFAAGIVIMLLIAIYLRYRWSFGAKSIKKLVENAQEKTDVTVLAKFICSHPRKGNGILCISKDRIWFEDQQRTLFEIPAADILKVEYSNRNFWRLIAKDKIFHFSYLHNLDEGKGLLNNLLLTPNLSYIDREATNHLIAILKSINVPTEKKPHIKLLFIPFQGSPFIILFMIVTWIIYYLYLQSIK